ncbi:MAG: phosphoribosylformylglycinamidine synthase subunit PurS [Elusimicrobia bacterium]|nr:phosphoribosylformylglycinamidine synthase subunit PurS [Elusimicrobiota bacterium]
MASYKILVKHKEEFFDAESERIKKDILISGIKNIISVKIAQIYEISGDISFQEIKEISKDLLVDPLTQLLFINFSLENESGKLAVEVYYKGGVTDSVAETIKIGIDDMNIKKELFVRTGKRYSLEGDLSKEEVKKIAEGILSNTVVQAYNIISGNVS